MAIAGAAEATESAALVHALFECSQDALILLSGDACVLEWSPRAEEIYGYGAYEAAGRHANCLEAAGQEGELAALVERAMRGESVRAHETMHVSRDGRVFPVTVALEPLREMDGKIVSVCAAVRDRTEVERLEANVRQLQKMEAVGRLAGGIAHDFNNLLTVIDGYARMTLEDMAAAEPLRGSLEEILKAVARATSLTRQILAFSRRHSAQPQVLDLNQVVRNMEKMLRRLLSENIELRTALTAEPVRLKADQAQMEQVIMNLVVNACDAMPHGGVVTIETGMAADGAATLVVSDTGRGMDSDTQLHLFEPFFTTKAAGKGTGLGLSMVHEIVSRARGRITVESQPGCGARFRILFPRAEEPCRAAQRPGPPSDVRRGSETILVVEDEPEVRRLVHRILHRQGYRVLEASSGEEALAMYRDHPERIPLLITDVILRQMNGRELYERLRHLRPDLKVVYMSGYPDDALARHGVLEDGTHFLRKPFTPDAFALILREVLDGLSADDGLQRAFAFAGPGAKPARTVIN